MSINLDEIERAGSDLSNCTLKLYETPADLVAEFFGLTVSDVKSGGFGGVDRDGKEFDFDMLAAVEEMGLWGYTDTTTGVIHAWISAKATAERVIEFLAHELGHNAEGTECTHDEYSSDHAKMLAEEARADRYAHVAVRAFELLSLARIGQATEAAGKGEGDGE